MFPRYRLPALTVSSVLRDLLLGRRRDFRADALACLKRLRPPLDAAGLEHIPAGGGFVVTVNHYFRPGFRAWWIPIAVGGTLPMSIPWVMTAELTFPGKWYGFLGRPISRRVLACGARMYGFVPMPPMPPRPRDAEARAAAVRQALALIRTEACPVLGLAPEGADMPAGRLCWPASGAGRFALLLAARGLRFLPAAVYEQDGRLCLRFGPNYVLEIPPGLTAGEKDRAAAEGIMRPMAALLPAALRGDFA